MKALELLYPRPLRAMNDHLARLIAGQLWMKVMLGMVAGILVGILTGPSMGWLEASTAATLGNWLAFPGQLFLTLVQMIVVPLVFASIIRGLAATENVEQLKKLGLLVSLTLFSFRQQGLYTGGLAGSGSADQLFQSNNFKVIVSGDMVKNTLTHLETLCIDAHDVRMPYKEEVFIITGRCIQSR